MDKQECLEILNQKIDEAQEETDRSPEGSSYGTLMLGRKQAFSDVRGLLKKLDEPEITTEQAWEKIAEEYKLPVETVQQIAGTTISSAVKKEDIAIRDGCIILNPNLAEPENPVVPKEFDEWYKEIQEKWSGNLAEQFALWKICQFGFGYEFEDVRDRDIESVSLINWVNGHKEEAIDAILYGYTTEKEPVWVVKVSEYTGFYLKEFTSGWDGKDTPKTYATSIKDKAYKFTDKQKAEAVATLVDGTVEEWSE